MDSFVADAQLAIMAMAWACGAGFPATFKNFTRFANQLDWASAAKEAKIKTDGNPGVVPRNAQVQLCLANAAAVTHSTSGTQDPDRLFWPGHVPPTGATDATRASNDVTVRDAAQAELASFVIDQVGVAGRGEPLSGSSALA